MPIITVASDTCEVQIPYQSCLEEEEESVAPRALSL